MSDSRWTMPPERDLGFYQRRKHDKWRKVDMPSPALESPVADTHAHVHLLPDPFWELKRAAANGVQLIGCVADPTEDSLDDVLRLADSYVRDEADGAGIEPADAPHEPGDVPDAPVDTPDEPAEIADKPTTSSTDMPDERTNAADAPTDAPAVIFTLGVHPHNAKDYNANVEARLIEALSHPNARVLGEIGLDYHYDFSPRDTQRDVFRQQIRLAKELGLPVSLHLRSGESPEDDAHAEAFAILSDEGFPDGGTLLHCCALPPDRLAPWIDADCYIAYGGALTFKNADEAREGARLVPRNRLLLETDTPYMTPEPMRGATCTPAHVIFTAAQLAEVLGATPGKERKLLLDDIWDNSNRFFGVDCPS